MANKWGRSGKPKNVEVVSPVAPSVPATTEQKEAKLIDMEMLDRSIEAKQSELAQFTERVRQTDLALKSIENEIEARKQYLADDLKSEKEIELEKIRALKDVLDVQAKTFEALEIQYSARNNELNLKEQAAARFELERKKFGDFSLQIEQMRMKAEQVMEEALTMRGEYEALLRDFNEKEREYNEKQDAQDIEGDRLARLNGELEAKQKDLNIQTMNLKEARRSLNGKALEEKVV